MKTGVTIAWNLLDFCIANALPKAERFRAGGYYSHFMLRILGHRLEPGKGGGRLLFMQKVSDGTSGERKNSIPIVSPSEPICGK
jgi:hypothetical protein